MAETTPEKTFVPNSVARILKDLDARLAAKKAELDAIAELKADVQKAVQYARREKMGEVALTAIVQSIVPAAAPARKGRPKGSKNIARPRKKRVKRTDVLVAKVRKLRKLGKTYEEIQAATGVGVQTIPKWLQA